MKRLLFVALGFTALLLNNDVAASSLIDANFLTISNGAVVTRGSVVRVEGEITSPTQIAGTGMNFPSDVVMCGNSQTFDGALWRYWVCSDWSVPNKPNVTYRLDIYGQDFDGDYIFNTINVQSSGKK